MLHRPLPCTVCIWLHPVLAAPASFAASIVAKVTRDRALRDFVLEEQGSEPAAPAQFGSGEGLCRVSKGPQGAGTSPGRGVCAGATCPP